MAKRLLLTLVALVLLLGLVLGVVWVVQNRRAGTVETPEGQDTSLPESGASVSPGTTLEGQSGDSSLACPERWTGLLDADSDGLPDTVEALYTANPENADTDGDGHTDGEEVRAGYDPLQKEGNPRLDSDGDGLPENEECQWKSDPFIADSDGDGFKDGDEVKNGFDPTVKGDRKGSDALPERRALAAAQELNKLRPRPDSDNLTERLAAQILGNRSSEQAETLTITPEELQRAIESTTFPLDTALPPVALAELSVETTNTPAGVRHYLDAADTVRPREFSSSTVFADALTRATSGDTSSLTLVRERLTQYEAELRRIVVPPSAVPYHRTLLGLVRFVRSRFESFEQFTQTDPVRAYVMLRELQEGVPRHSQTLEQLRSDLDQVAGGKSSP